QYDPAPQRPEVHELFPCMHSAADRPQAVEHGNASGIGEEVREGDAAALGLDLQVPAAGGGELDGAAGPGGLRAMGIDGRDGLAEAEGEGSAGGNGDVAGQSFEPAGDLTVLGGAEEAGLALGHGAVRHDVELPLGADEGGGAGEVFHEGR